MPPPGYRERLGLGLRGTAAGGLRAEPDGPGADAACAREAARSTRSPDDDGTLLRVNQRALTNTVEQLTGFAPALLALAARRVRPVGCRSSSRRVLVFALARLVFWGGYLLGPLARAPGMAATFAVNVGDAGCRGTRCGGRSSQRPDIRPAPNTAAHSSARERDLAGDDGGDHLPGRRQRFHASGETFQPGIEVARDPLQLGVGVPGDPLEPGVEVTGKSLEPGVELAAEFARTCR